MDHFSLRPQDLPVSTRFLGGPACLDFANPTEQLRSARPEDWLSSYGVLVVWSRARGTLGAGVARRLDVLAGRDPAGALEVFAKALEIRCAIRTVAAAFADGTPAAGAVGQVNRWLAALPPQPPVTLADGARLGAFDLRGETLEEPLWPILWSLTGLLTSDQATQVRRCEGVGCGYFFVDTTSNRSRRFCSSAGCGNRARAQRFSRLHRPTPQQVAPALAEAGLENSEQIVD